MKGLKSLILLPVLIVALSSCSPQKNAKIELLDAKTAKGIDGMYKPVEETSVFPQGTTTVFCWFSWKNAEKGINITARWKYVTDDIPILRSTFAISRKEGEGGVSLVMPPGKTLPPGVYRVSLEFEKEELKALTFKVLENN